MQAQQTMIHSASAMFHLLRKTAESLGYRARQAAKKAEGDALCAVPSAFILRSSAFSFSPRGRFELPTLRLTAECSAIELTGNSVCYPGLSPALGELKSYSNVASMSRSSGGIAVDSRIFPTSHCVPLPPKQLVSILLYQCNGIYTPDSSSDRFSLRASYVSPMPCWALVFIWA